MWTEKVVLPTIYDFDYTLYRLSFDPVIALDMEERSVKVPVVMEEERQIVQVQATGTTEKPSFLITGEKNKEKLLPYIYDLFQWEFDLSVVAEHFTGTILESLFTKYPGTPIVREFDLYFCLIKTIIHQQLNMKFAYVLSTRFIEAYGEKVDGVWFYPTPERVASLTVEELRGMQFSTRKAEYIIDTSKLIVEGKIDLNDLRLKLDVEVLAELVKIRGIGPWTIENWLLFGLGRKDLFPKADIGIQNAVKQLLTMDKKPTVDELSEMSLGWEPYRSYASLTLWRSIE
ncbi:DNA-3-methyladenine glycosylase 2 family protein [Oceanobacillus piezotolerans]|uniref:DNA-3-methyladenine glycosylase II n=1 Tax=Oceanobacillus piezotolerans TaxID=2448030 RepID=A0A498D646_9BACI|nr:DNA-3-methyladenine glycosylase [Oceanobacillus piezotolerans]RLL40359.1 DNA-3-methyladenine glycosylase 2 family protein [Oceanobacillus piezotolerans]